MSSLFLFITLLGDWKVILGGSIITVIFLIRKHHWSVALTLASSLVLAEASVQILKKIIAVPRPPLADEFLFATTGGFPSGHTVMSIIFYGLLVFLFYQNVGGLASHKKTARIAAAILVSFIPIAVAISRIVLGIHYPWQVAASAAIGIAWLAITVRVFKKIKHRELA